MAILGNGRRLLDSTSGNMGISYATYGAALDIPVTLVLPASASPERIAILRALGAELILTDPLEGSDGAILKPPELAAEHPDKYWYPMATTSRTGATSPVTGDTRGS